jgi:putative sterol carrier protein
MKPNKSTILSFATTLLLLTAGPVQAAPVLMSAEWATQACQAWNQDPVLTKDLAEKWIKNDEGRGYKAMQLYRRDCADSPKVELKVSEKDGEVMCVYGGQAKDTLNKSVDYLMWADTNRWEEMGAGKYGPMKAMLLFRLKFKGPKWEAMKNMGPFRNFLLLTGKVPSDASSCPS